MKKVMLFALALVMTACPVACINDPTQSEQVCPGTDTGTSCLVEDESTETSTVDETSTDVDTATGTVVE